MSNPTDEALKAYHEAGGKPIHLEDRSSQEEFKKFKEKMKKPPQPDKSE